MTSFSKKAKAEAAKYKHQISPKARHKYTFNCGVGSKGFEPGNDCAGGKGKFDPTDRENTTVWERIIHKEPRGNHEVFLSDTEEPPTQERVEVVKRFIDVVGKDRFLVSDKGVIFEGLTRNAAKLLSQEIAKVIPVHLIDVMENGSDVYSKDGKKRTFASDCGAGKQGSKGFQPGNTCGGDGDGKNDAGDQGGGDKKKIGRGDQVLTALQDDLADAIDDGASEEKLQQIYNDMASWEQDELPEDIIDHMRDMDLIDDDLADDADSENVPVDFDSLPERYQPGQSDDYLAEERAGLNKHLENAETGEDFFDSAMSSKDPVVANSATELYSQLNEDGYEHHVPMSDEDLEVAAFTLAQNIHENREDAPEAGDQGGDDPKKQLAENEAQIAELRQQIAEQKAVADSEIAEAYKDVTEEDIQDMLEEKDITAAEAEEMRGWVAQAQAAQADDASDSEFGPDDVLPRASEEAGLRQDQEYIDSLAADDRDQTDLTQSYLNELEGFQVLKDEELITTSAFEDELAELQSKYGVNPGDDEPVATKGPDVLYPALGEVYSLESIDHLENSGEISSSEADALRARTMRAGEAQADDAGEEAAALAEEDYLADLSESELEEVLGPGSRREEIEQQLANNPEMSDEGVNEATQELRSIRLEEVRNNINGGPDYSELNDQIASMNEGNATEQDLGQLKDNLENIAYQNQGKLSASIQDEGKSYDESIISQYRAYQDLVNGMEIQSVEDLQRYSDLTSKAFNDLYNSINEIQSAAPEAQGGTWEPGNPLDEATSRKVDEAAERMAQDFPEYSVEQHRQMLEKSLVTPERDLPFTEGQAEELLSSFGMEGEKNAIGKMMEMVGSSVDYVQLDEEEKSYVDQLIRDGNTLRFIYDETQVNPRDLDRRSDEIA